MIADMASAPYEAVARRIKELKLPISTSLQKYSENEWINQRKILHLTESPLDKPFSFTRFYKYEKEIEKSVQKGKLSKMEAASKLAHWSPNMAKHYQQEAMKKLNAAQEKDRQ